MSKITNDRLTQWSGIGCFRAVPIWQQWASKGWDCKLYSQTKVQALKKA